jgi:hypothetical protein
MEVHPGGMEAHLTSERRRLTLEPYSLTLKPYRLTLKTWRLAKSHWGAPGVMEVHLSAKEKKTTLFSSWEHFTGVVEVTLVTLETGGSWSRGGSFWSSGGEASLCSMWSMLNCRETIVIYLVCTYHRRLNSVSYSDFWRDLRIRIKRMQIRRQLIHIHISIFGDLSAALQSFYFS